MNQEYVFTPTAPSMEEWRCAITNCKTLLGIKHQGGLLVIKYKGLHLELKGSYDILVHCRRCAARNRIRNLTLEEIIKEHEYAETPPATGS